MRPADIRAAENLASAIQKKTGAELALVTIETYAPYAALDDYSLALAESWGIGRKGKDDGVLLILAAGERKVKIEVGYGLEGAIPDSAAGKILDAAVIPAFRQGDFSGGLLKGAQAIAAAIAKENGIDPADFNLPAGSTDSGEEGYGGLFMYILPILLLIVFKSFLPLLFLGGFSRRRGFGSGGFGSSRGGFGGFGGGGFGGGGASRGF
jgi:uncharacterized protein